MNNPLLQHKTAAIMDRSKVMEALKAVNHILSEKGLTETATVVGGAAIMFLFPEFNREVKDLDGCDLSEDLLKVIEQVAWEVDGLPDWWFNNTSNLYIQPKEKEEGPQLSNLRIYTPTKNYLLCLKLKSGRTEEEGNDAKDIEFMIEHMPNITTSKDWQDLYRHYFGKADWKPWLAERADIAINRKSAFKKNADSTEPNQQSPAEPLLNAMINQSEWKRQERVHIFTEPEDDLAELNGVKLSSTPGEGEYAITTDDSGQFWGSEGAGLVFWCPNTQRVLIARRSKYVNEPGTWGTWGGSMEAGESPADAARREADEEAGYEIHSIELVWTFKDSKSDFRYHNFVATVDEQFKPHMDWETDGYRWVPVTVPPEPVHFGLKAFWPHLKEWTARFKTSSLNRLASMDLVSEAEKYAREVHSTQSRKFTGEPYFNHLEAVAASVASVGGTPEMIAAAYLHDSIEDQGITAEQIKEKFGPHVAKLVVEMTQVSKLEDGNRATRKEIDRKHYSQISPEGQTIKLADIINNGYDIVDSNPKFARTYIPELEALFHVLVNGNATLRIKAGKMLEYAKGKLPPNKTSQP